MQPASVRAFPTMATSGYSWFIEALRKATGYASMRAREIQEVAGLGLVRAVVSDKRSGRGVRRRRDTQVTSTPVAVRDFRSPVCRAPRLPRRTTRSSRLSRLEAVPRTRQGKR